MLLAFAAIYLIWGSTYLAIRFAVETLPPLLMMGTRFLIGGVIFLLYAVWRGELHRPTVRQWRTVTVISILMLCGGTGTVGWAETRIPSGLAALLVAGVPFWITLSDWLRPNGHRPGLATVSGLIVGFIGIGILIGPEHFAGGHRVDLLGGTAVILASLAWAIGSVYSRHNHEKLPTSQYTAVGMELLIAAVVLVALGVAFGESSRVTFSAVSLKSILAVVYLGLIGSLAFGAYVWLLKASTPAKAATYAYVNPVVAVVLGVTLGGEPINLRTVLASVVIISAVAVITTSRTTPKPTSAPSPVVDSKSA